MEKTKSIIHYIISCFSAEPTKLGKVKLAKILWFCAREFMYKNKQHLSDLEFIKMPLGLVPKKYDTLLNQLEKDKIIHIFTAPNFNKKQICFHSLKDPDLKAFTPDEISLIDSVIFALKDEKAGNLSNLTHDSVWENTKQGNVMPVESVFLKDIEAPSPEDIEWANKTITQCLS